ncbi:hypothetical protein H6G06_13385 [Anabaena sphaerica FACHB-251]|uniref:Apea-like HEPN domain-containing protein n=1 Tax=Anabaena sphaerica FACHB-251 TaxID=2692883 RepID=A0A926WI04_9NOST|nr:HEPN domain-containing protein [Anabaena sphaerica]MBD2294445.1 hypothetical protein [Anabaena sphaerica FACHB-251]
MEVTFLISIHHLEIQGNLGRGDKIDDFTFLSNDINTLKKIIPSESIPIIGKLEYESLMDSKPYVYSVEKLPEGVSPQEFLVHKLYCVQSLLSAIWFYEDNNVDFEIGFLFYVVDGRLGVSSNFLATKYTTSSGKQKTLILNRDKLRSIRQFYREHLGSEGELFGHPYSTQLVKGRARTALALYHITGARFDPDVGLKVSNYCSALEALFSTSQAELAHQLSERLAFFISTSSEERLNIYKQTKQAYTVRSKIVHGSTIRENDIDKVKELSEFCDTSLRKAMNKILSSPDLRAIIDGSPEKLDAYIVDLIFGIIQ